MKVLKHDYEADEPRLDLLSQSLNLFEKCDAVGILSEYLTTFVYVAGDIMQNSCQVPVGVFLRHMWEWLLSFGV
ncbi:MAG TPA: hypothetical protein VJV05_03940 [Pyrinomonadaceae bacterium]|nr:hypothetical protein [Pyrinomonadaceae bacterium]